jgi:UDP-N-acetylglucosamine--N-acetylmuramyl-(pentapeptide) pyrophosphoryl-undecaprenol N-acetylglucosamine transferase
MVSQVNDNGVQSTAFRLLVTGGGTGGHTYPAVAVVRSLRSRLAASGMQLEVWWAGVAGSLEAGVAAGERIQFRAVATGKLRRSDNPLRMVSLANGKDMARVPYGAVQAGGIVRDLRPDAVLATGGYVALPVGLAARWCRRPLVVHEQTVALGLANRVLARAATCVAVSSESTLPLLPASARACAVVTGNPVRPEILRGDQSAAITALGWQDADRSLPVVYVTGGAQGSAQLNELVAGLLPWLLSRAHVIHQCGPANVAEVRRRAMMPAGLPGRYLVTGFTGPELPDVLALADVVISRSGAGTIAEITALGLASVLVPLASSAGGEQRRNAAFLAGHGAAAVAPLGEVTPETLRAALGPLLADPRYRGTVAAKARSLGRPEAAELLAGAVLSAAARTRTGTAVTALPPGEGPLGGLGSLPGACLDQGGAGVEGILGLPQRVGHILVVEIQFQVRLVAACDQCAYPGQDSAVHGGDSVCPFQQLGGDLGAAVAAEVIADPGGGRDHGGVRVFAGEPG